MIIKNIKIKNFKSFGNNQNEINLNTENGQLVLLQGINGSGKCLKNDSLLNIYFSLKSLPERVILALYIKVTDADKANILNELEKTNHHMYALIKDRNNSF